MRSRVYILGVTGVIGSGKSMLCRFLERRFGYHWIDADAITHELYRRGKLGYEKIHKYFGLEYVDRFEVNRNKLRRFVLKHPRKILLLNRLIHPLITHEVYKKIVQIKRANKAKRRIFICIESVYFDRKNLGKFIDQQIRLDAEDAVLMERLRSRKILKYELGKLLSFQRKWLSCNSLSL